MRIVVGIATAGRPTVLLETLREIQLQTRPADEVLVCPAAEEDLPDMSASPIGVRIVRGQRGSSAQRNVILDAAPDADSVVFFDDECFPDSGYLAAVEASFEDPSVVMTTGLVIRDDILGPGMSPEEARSALADFVGPTNSREPRYNAYGCNMALRNAVAQAGRIRFDERLPLYGWLEDVDFSRLMSAHGAIIWDSAARGVHLGNKRGRSPGLRLGYSQIANPIYLWRKGTMRADRAFAQMGRNVAANIVKLGKVEPWVDRRGRAAGNALAVFHLLTGRLRPECVVTLGEAKAASGIEAAA